MSAYPPLARISPSPAPAKYTSSRSYPRLSNVRYQQAVRESVARREAREESALRQQLKRVQQPVVHRKQPVVRDFDEDDFAGRLQALQDKSPKGPKQPVVRDLDEDDFAGRLRALQDKQPKGPKPPTEGSKKLLAKPAPLTREQQTQKAMDVMRTKQGIERTRKVYEKQKRIAQQQQTQIAQKKKTIQERTKTKEEIDSLETQVIELSEDLELEKKRFIGVETEAMKTLGKQIQENVELIAKLKQQDAEKQTAEQNLLAVQEQLKQVEQGHKENMDRAQRELNDLEKNRRALETLERTRFTELERHRLSVEKRDDLLLRKQAEINKAEATQVETQRQLQKLETAFSDRNSLNAETQQKLRQQLEAEQSSFETKLNAAKKQHQADVFELKDTERVAIAKLEIIKTHAANELTTRQLRIQTLEEQIFSMDGQSQQVETNLRKELAASQKEVEDMKLQSNQTLEDVQNQMNTLNDEKSAAIQQSVERETLLTEKLNILSEQVAEQIETQKQFVDSANKHQLEEKELTDKLVAAEKNENSLRSKLSLLIPRAADKVNSKREITELRQQVEDAHRSAKATQERADELSFTNRQYLDEQKTLSRELDELRSEKAEQEASFRTQVNALTNMVADKHMQSEEKQKHFDELTATNKKKIEDRESASRAASRELDELRIRATHLESEAATANTNKEQVKAEYIEQLANLVRLAETAKRASEEERDKLKSTFQGEVQALIDGQIDAKAHFKQSEIRLKTELLEEQKHHAITTEKLQLEIDKSKDVSEIERQHRETVGQLHAASDTLKNDVTRSEQDIEDLKAKHTSLVTSINADFEQRQRTYRNLIAQQARQMEVTHALEATHKSELEQLRQDSARNLHQEVQKIKEENKMKELASVSEIATLERATEKSNAKLEDITVQFSESQNLLRSEIAETEELRKSIAEEKERYRELVNQSGSETAQILEQQREELKALKEKTAVELKALKDEQTANYKVMNKDKQKQIINATKSATERVKKAKAQVVEVEAQMVETERIYTERLADAASKIKSVEDEFDQKLADAANRSQATETRLKSLAAKAADELQAVTATMKGDTQKAEAVVAALNKMKNDLSSMEFKNTELSKNVQRIIKERDERENELTLERGLRNTLTREKAQLEERSVRLKEILTAEETKATDLRATNVRLERNLTAQTKEIVLLKTNNTHLEKKQKDLGIEKQRIDLQVLDFQQSIAEKDKSIAAFERTREEESQKESRTEQATAEYQARIESLQAERKQDELLLNHANIEHSRIIGERDQARNEAIANTTELTKKLNEIKTLEASQTEIEKENRALKANKSVWLAQQETLAKTEKELLEKTTAHENAVSREEKVSAQYDTIVEELNRLRGSHDVDEIRKLFTITEEELETARADTEKLEKLLAETAESSATLEDHKKRAIQMETIAKNKHADSNKHQVAAKKLREFAEQRYNQSRASKLEVKKYKAVSEKVNRLNREYEQQISTLETTKKEQAVRLSTYAEETKTWLSTDAQQAIVIRKLQAEQDAVVVERNAERKTIAAEQQKIVVERGVWEKAKKAYEEESGRLTTSLLDSRGNLAHNRDLLEIAQKTLLDGQYGKLHERVNSLQASLDTERKQVKRLVLLLNNCNSRSSDCDKKLEQLEAEHRIAQERIEELETQTRNSAAEKATLETEIARQKAALEAKIAELTHTLGGFGGYTKADLIARLNKLKEHTDRDFAGMNVYIKNLAELLLAYKNTVTKTFNTRLSGKGLDWLGSDRNLGEMLYLLTEGDERRKKQLAQYCRESDDCILLLAKLAVNLQNIGAFGRDALPVSTLRRYEQGIAQQDLPLNIYPAYSAMLMRRQRMLKKKYPYQKQF